MDIKCRKEQLNGGGGNTQSINFEIDKDTRFVSVAFQDKRVGSSSNYSKTFFSVGGASGADGNALGDEMKLKQIMINYKNINRPLVERDLQFVNKVNNTSPGVDFTGRLYMENVLTSNKYYMHDSPESLEVFHVGGPYYHFDTSYNPNNETSNNLQVTAQFYANQLQNPATPLDTSTINMLLFEHIKKDYRVKIDKDGRISSIKRLN
jgi:hypothetical protein